MPSVSGRSARSSCCFTFAAGYLFFRERSNALELIGIGLVAGGILLLLLHR
jgi:multidrug transporter EmrE-like cation transporter